MIASQQRNILRPHAHGLALMGNCRPACCQSGIATNQPVSVVPELHQVAGCQPLQLLAPRPVSGTTCVSLLLSRQSAVVPVRLISQGFERSGLAKHPDVFIHCRPRAVTGLFQLVAQFSSNHVLLKTAQYTCRPALNVRNHSLFVQSGLMVQSLSNLCGLLSPLYTFGRNPF